MPRAGDGGRRTSRSRVVGVGPRDPGRPRTRTQPHRDPRRPRARTEAGAIDRRTIGSGVGAGVGAVAFLAAFALLEPSPVVARTVRFRSTRAVAGGNRRSAAAPRLASAGRALVSVAVAAAPLSSGKLPARLLAELLAALPPPPPELLLGPAVGEDACAIQIPAGVLVAASDPITLTSGELGRFSVVVNANDVAVSGARPRWFLAVLLAPPGTAAEELHRLFADLGRALEEVGAHLVGGHTEVTGAVTRTVVVGQMLGLAEEGRVVSTGGARAGDVIVQVGAVPIEGAAVLAHEAAARLDAIDAVALNAAREALADPGISVVEPALTAARLAATALHDPTEGGLAGGLHELAHASGVRIRVDRAAVLWFEPGLRVCEALGADPWAALASGSLLAAFPPDRAEAAREELAAAGFAVAEIGVVEPGSGVVDADGCAVAWPERDEVERVLSARGA